mgnify:CR=1 FL=1
MKQREFITLLGSAVTASAVGSSIPYWRLGAIAYGASSGTFLIQGNADARAGIRLSGADMVLGGQPHIAATVAGSSTHANGLSSQR